MFSEIYLSDLTQLGNILDVIILLTLGLIAFLIYIFTSTQGVLGPLLKAKRSGRILIIRGGQHLTPFIVGPKEGERDYTHKLSDDAVEDYSIKGVRLLPNKVSYVLSTPDKDVTFSIDQKADDIEALYTAVESGRKIFSKSQQAAAKERAYFEKHRQTINYAIILIAIGIVAWIVFTYLKCPNCNDLCTVAVETAKKSVVAPPVQ